MPHRAYPAGGPHGGDLVVALGGRTRLDGLHGAILSSPESAADTQATLDSIVQIGDPILEKGLSDLIHRARDAGLYTVITDCGAGGFASAGDGRRSWSWMR